MRNVGCLLLPNKLGTGSKGQIPPKLWPFQNFWWSQETSFSTHFKRIKHANKHRFNTLGVCWCQTSLERGPKHKYHPSYGHFKISDVDNKKSTQVSQETSRSTHSKRIKHANEHRSEHVGCQLMPNKLGTGSKGQIPPELWSFTTFEWSRQNQSTSPLTNPIIKSIQPIYQAITWDLVSSQCPLRILGEGGAMGLIRMWHKHN